MKVFAATIWATSLAMAVLAISSPLNAHNQGAAATANPRATTSSRLILADGHSDQCLANYKQCMKGCDGATSCSNQCQVNYDQCLKQGA